VQKYLRLVEQSRCSIGPLIDYCEGVSRKNYMQNHWRLVQNLVQKYNYKCKILIIWINYAKKVGNMHKPCINIYKNITNINLIGIEFAPKKVV